MYNVIMNKLIILFIASFLLVVTPGFAKLYKWTDEKGELHVVDTISKIPEEYLHLFLDEEGNELELEEEEEGGGSYQHIAPPKGKKSTAPVIDLDVYGDHPLIWWKNTFDKSFREIEELEGSYEDKKDLVDLYEKGRRKGQRYSEEETMDYFKNKKSVKEKNDALQKLKDDLQELRRKARYHGVPKKIRGE